MSKFVPFFRTSQPTRMTTEKTKAETFENALTLTPEIADRRRAFDASSEISIET